MKPSAHSEPGTGTPNRPVGGPQPLGRAQGVPRSELVGARAASKARLVENRKMKGEGPEGPRAARLCDVPVSGLDLAAVAPKQIEHIRARWREGYVVARHAELVAFIDGVATTDVGPVDPVDGATDGDADIRPAGRRHRNRCSGVCSNLQVHLVVRWADRLRYPGDLKGRVSGADGEVHRAEGHLGPCGAGSD